MPWTDLECIAGTQFNLAAVRRHDKYIWANCHDEDELLDQRLIECPSPMSEEDAETVLSGYVADPRTTEELRAWMSELALAIRFSDLFRSEARDLAARIE